MKDENRKKIDYAAHRFVEVNGAKYCYLEAGQGPMVLLVHVLHREQADVVNREILDWFSPEVPGDKADWVTMATTPSEPGRDECQQTAH